jgi:hypothetical protein
LKPGETVAQKKCATVGTLVSSATQRLVGGTICRHDHVLTIQTADQQRYANILLTLGVRMD